MLYCRSKDLVIMYVKTEITYQGINQIKILK